MTAPDTIDVALVRALLEEQFPAWAHLPIEPVAVSGWDNRTFHLGAELCVRLPSHAVYASAIDKEHTWLPRLAPHLPLPVPHSVALGHASSLFPWSFSVRRWLPGEAAERTASLDGLVLARDLAAFLVALRSVPVEDAPLAGAHSFERGSHPRCYGGQVEAALDTGAPDIDRRAVATLWEAAMATEWDAAPVWLHGDVAAGNLLMHHGRLAAVIDFGTCAVGDPACDLVIAWTFLEGGEREVFRSSLGLNDDTWLRGQAWALWKALILHTGLARSNAREMAAAPRVLSALGVLRNEKARP